MIGEFSAGGIVFKRKALSKKQKKILKRIQDDIFILVCQHSQHHGWVFPKGFIGDKEEFRGQGKEETAIREVKEETGIVGKIVKPLTPIAYWYVMDYEKRKKTVYYFIMEFAEGNTNNHDFEMEKVEWLRVDEVEKRLTFDSDKTVWKQAKELIEKLSS